MKEVLIGNILVGRLYEGRFRKEMTSQLYDETRRFLSTEIIQRQMRPITESDEVWIKVNLVNARPPETGCVNHPATVKAVVDHVLNVLDFKGPIRMCETNSFYKGPAFFTKKLPSYIPPREQEVILAKVKAKDPGQDMYDFGFELAAELSGIRDLAQNYEAANMDVRVLNVSKEPVMTSEDRRQLIDKVEQFLGGERIPMSEVRDEVMNNIPRALRDKKLGLISLATAKTHDSPQVWATASIKNVAVGLLPQLRKGFMHKDLAKAIIYNYAVWQMGCGGRVFGIVSGPYGMDGAGPVWGRSVDFPYIIAGSDLLEVDCATAMLMFGKPDLIPQIRQFSHAHDKIGRVLSKDELQKLQPYTLNYEPHKY